MECKINAISHRSAVSPNSTTIQTLVGTFPWKRHFFVVLNWLNVFGCISTQPDWGIAGRALDNPPRHVWYVGDITWPSQEVVLDGRIIDCSENWSAGCLLDLPGDIPAELVRPQQQ